MANTMRVPTEFTAIDKFTAVVSKMVTATNNFSRTAEAAVGRVNRRFDRMIGLTDQVKGALAGLTVGAVIAMGIQDLKNYEDAIASFRTIVSDLSDKEFSKYRQAIGNVAKDTKKSTIDVAQSFEKIAGLNAEFAKTADGISEISKQAIILSKASGADETENLVGIMNQFALGANEAARASNVLAAGQAVGASTIAQSSEAYKNFGSVAKGANITLEQSQALIQTLGKYSLFGAEAGTKLRGSVLQLQKAGLGYKSGQFQINDALLDAQKKMNKLSTAKAKDAYLTKLFGAENITAGKILLSNIDTFNTFTKEVTGTSAAQEQAAIKSNTLSTKIQELRNSFTNLITTNEETGKGVVFVKEALGFLANNMDMVLTGVVALIGVYAAFKVAQIALVLWTTASSVAMGIAAASAGGMSIAMKGNVVAIGTYNVITKSAAFFTGAWTAAQWLLNAALTANPIGVIIMAIAALIAVVVLVIAKWDEWGAALSLFMGPLGWIISLIQSFRRNWDMVVKAFKTDGILGGLKAIGIVILDAILMPVQQLLELLSKIPGLGDLAGSGAKKIMEIRQSLGVDTGEVANKPVKKLDSPEQMQNTIMQNNKLNGNIDVNIKDKGGNVEKTDYSGFNGIPVNLSTTQGAF